MSHRKSSRITVDVSIDNVQNIFEQLEAQLGGWCNGRSSRKLVRIRNILTKHIEDCGRYQVVVKNIIKQALDYFDKRRDQFFRYHDCVGILVIAAHLAQRYDIQQEPVLIEGVLKRIFIQDGGFAKIMNILDPLIFPDEVDNIIYPLRNGNEIINTTSEDHLNIMEYFLREGGHVKVMVTYSEWELLSVPLRPPRRMKTCASLVDAPIPACRGSSPLLLACQSLSHTAVLLLLRYGAEPFKTPSIFHSRALGWQFQHPLYHIIMKLNVVAAWSQQTGITDPVMLRQFKNAQAGQEADALKCLSYFSRAILQLPLVRSESQARIQDSDSKCYFYLNSQHLDLFPVHKWKTPAKLQHSARCRIRQLLPPSGIPRAIQKLPLPPLLKSYLDLLYD